MTALNPLDRDQMLREIRDFLPGPVREESQLDGSLALTGGDPGEVIVRVRRSLVTVAVFAVVWEGPHSPVQRPKTIGSLNWKRLPASRLVVCLHELIDSARAIRSAKFRMCQRCGETKPPEWMHDEQTCQACAELHLGIVH